MKSKRFLYLVVIVALVVAPLLSLAITAQAQTTLPTAATVAGAMTVGWNLGNTLEARGAAQRLPARGLQRRGCRRQPA